MTEDRLPLAELMAKAGGGDFLRGVAEAVVQLLMETDVDGSYQGSLTGTYHRHCKRSVAIQGRRNKACAVLPWIAAAQAGLAMTSMGHDQ